MKATYYYKVYESLGGGISGQVIFPDQRRTFDTLKEARAYARKYKMGDKILKFSDLYGCEDKEYTI